MFFTTTTLSRSEFGMKAHVPYVGDEVHIPINFEGIKQSTPPTVFASIRNFFTATRWFEYLDGRGRK